MTQSVAGEDENINVVLPRGVIFCEGLNQLLRLIKWATLSRREWRAETVKAGWNVDIEIASADGDNWKESILMQAEVIQL